MSDIDLFRGMNADIAFIRKMMHRRHIFEHNAGVADKRYVQESGDSDAREGVLVRESQENAHQLILPSVAPQRTSIRISTKYFHLHDGRLNTFSVVKGRNNNSLHHVNPTKNARYRKVTRWHGTKRERV